MKRQRRNAKRIEKGWGKGREAETHRVAISAPSGLSPAPSILSTPGEKAEDTISKRGNGRAAQRAREREIGRGRGRGKGLIKDRRYSTREVEIELIRGRARRDGEIIRLIGN